MSGSPPTMERDGPMGVLISAATLSPSPSPLPPSPSGGRKHTVSPTSIFLLIGIWIFIVLLGCRLMFTMMGLVSNCFCCCCAFGPTRSRSARQQRGASGELVAVVERGGSRRSRRRGGGYDTAMSGFNQHTRTISDATIQTFTVRTFKAMPGMAPRPYSETPTLPLYTTPPSTPPPDGLPPRPATFARTITPPRSLTPRWASRASTPGPISPPPVAPPGDHTTLHIPEDARPDTAPVRDTSSPAPCHRRAHSLDAEASTSQPAAPLADPADAAASRAAKLYTVAGPERISTSTGAGAGSGEGLRAGGRAPGGDLARGTSTSAVLAHLGAGLDWLRSRATTTPSPEPGATPSAADGTSCPICLSDYLDGELLRTLPCKHEFHVECIDPWMAMHPTCPVCRHDLLPYEVADGQAVDRFPAAAASDADADAAA